MCGCTAGGNRASTAQKFGGILQNLLRECLCGEARSRMRIFDDYTISNVEIEKGLVAAFTACRASQFARLRTAAGISEEQFRDSMCAHPFLGGDMDVAGKSGSLFLRSHDEQFVLKTIDLHEFNALAEILATYVIYLEENPKSLLCRIFGAYEVKINKTTLRFVAMANCLQGKGLQIYDLKGTTEDRWVDPAKQSVLKDNNFRPYTMSFDQELQRRLLAIIRDDSEFLESLGLMDYSLLLGISAANSLTTDAHRIGILKGFLSSQHGPPDMRVFQLGIIDYLQRWTPKKIVAHWLKKPTLGCCHEIDTEPPRIYCKRFYKYFVSKILEIPDSSEVSTKFANGS